MIAMYVRNARLVRKNRQKLKHSAGKKPNANRSWQNEKNKSVIRLNR